MMNTYDYVAQLKCKIISLCMWCLFPEHVFISPSFLKDIFTVYSILDGHVLQQLKITVTKRNNKYWQGYGEMAPLLQCWWECQVVQP